MTALPPADSPAGDTAGLVLPEIDYTAIGQVAIGGLPDGLLEVTRMVPRTTDRTRLPSFRIMVQRAPQLQADQVTLSTEAARQLVRALADLGVTAEGGS